MSTNDPAAGAEPPPGPTPALPQWEPPPPAAKPEGVEYGFLNAARDELVGTTRERLVYLCRTSPPPLVWTPETPRLVPVWEVPYLLDAVREKLAARARRSLKQAALVSLVVLAVAVMLGGPWSVLFTVPLVLAWLTYLRGGEKRARATTVEDFRASEANARYALWEGAQPAPRTQALTYVLIATAAAQVLWLPSSVAAAGMDPERVRDGEVWRLLSGALLHGSAIHWMMNFSALVSLGRTMEARAPRAYVPLVFLASALGGSLASLYLPPHVVSVGASGGLLGMMGFLLVLALRRAGHLPHGFRRVMMQNLLLMGAIGVVGYKLIDNAAHGGGLVAGLLVGAAVIPGGDRVPEWTGSARLDRIGLGAQLLLWAAAAATIAVILARVL